ncbi:MAG TPA: hypothetical protein PLY22_03435, partial [Fervidobacterium sp.]|nr:hypothetical protein [Fervidobacterium sp.]
LSKMAQLLEIQITDEATLFEACDYEHDAFFDERNISELNDGVWSIEYDREYFEETRGCRDRGCLFCVCKFDGSEPKCLRMH